MKADRPKGVTLGLRAYLAVLIVLFTATALASTVFVRAESEAVARRVATRDAQFAADLAASEVATGLSTLETFIASLAVNPGVPSVFDRVAPCNLIFSTVGIFRSAHLDLLAPDGSVVCSSARTLSPGVGYGGAAWLASAMRGATFAGPVADARTGGVSAVSAAPVPGRGVVAGFVDLADLGPVLGARFSGPYQFEFIVTTADRKTAVSRSVDPARWLGASLEATPFYASAGGPTVDVDGMARLYAQAPVGNRDWKVYAGMDEALALTSTSGLLAQDLIITLAGLFVLLVGTLIVYRLITKPIHDLSVSVRGGMNGEMRLPAGFSGPREIVDLARDFERLIAKVQTELTDRQHAEARVRAMVDAALDAFIAMDQEGDVIEWSQQAATMFGWSRSEALGRQMRDLIIPERLRAAHKAAYEQFRHQGIRPESGRRVERDFVARDGREFPGEMTVSTVATPNGHIFSAFVRDLTESRAAEAERSSLEVRLRQSERLESIGRLVGGIAHDFNNLMAVILNYTDFIADRISPGDPSAGDLAQIRGAAERATRFTRQLLTFARRDAVRPEAVDMGHLVREIEPILRRTLRENIGIEVALAPDLSAVRADRGQVEQMILNLVVNAGDAMPDGGTLRITTENAQHDPESAAQYPDLAPGSYVLLTVTDSGVGMSKEVLDHAFEPFYTTKPQGKGTGLGLATVYGVVKQAGGRISIYSDVGKGTSVRVLLPAVARSTPAVEPGQVTPVATEARAKATILLVEDEDGVREAARRILARAGYTVIDASRPDAALRDVADRIGTIDLLLTDMVMPGMSGRELVKQLRALRPDLRVVYMTGYSDELAARREEALEGPILGKPFTREPLLALVARGLDSPPAG